MTYTREDLINDVTKEAQALRVHATAEERSKLSFESLKPSNMNNCIYGLMTGNCFTERAALLIDQCCVRFFKHEIMPDYFRVSATIDNILKGVNGVKVENFVEERTGIADGMHYSAIEAYILLPDAKNANLIAYLKGETETLDL